MALNAGYFRTWFGAFTATDNRAVTAADFNPYCITAPADAAAAGRRRQFRSAGSTTSRRRSSARSRTSSRQAANYGKQTEVYNGVDVSLNARLKAGAMLGGGFNVGRSATNNCDVVTNRPQIQHLSPSQAVGPLTAPRLPEFCDVRPPFLTQLKLNGAFGLPYGFRTGITYQNLPGIPIYATYVATNAQIAPVARAQSRGGTRAARSQWT